MLQGDLRILLICVPILELFGNLRIPYILSPTISSTFWKTNIAIIFKHKTRLQSRTPMMDFC